MGLLSWMRKLLGKGEPAGYERFRDGLGNFEIFYPRGWRYDEDIAVVDGKYSITFESPDHRSEFTVSVDAKLPFPFDFERYARAELESPESGIYTPVNKGKFHGREAFLREYSYSSGGRAFFGGGVMFSSGRIVYSFSWTGPENERERTMTLFEHMKRTVIVREGYSERQAGAIGTIGIAKRRKGKAS